MANSKTQSGQSGKPGVPQANAAPSRDGTSQSARLLPALDPNYAQIDERTTRDLLAFAREYARELRYFGLEDPDNAQGDWSNFIGSADLDGASGKSAVETSAANARPHFALFLTFLELLGEVRGQINTLTRRHLEFFYRDVLRMSRKRAVPDRVHVLVDLGSGTDAQLLPAGTILSAGKDSLGQDLEYRSDDELVANRVQVARLSSLYADLRITDVRQASRQYRHRGTRDDAFVAMLRIALGQPDPGDPLPVDLDADPPLYPGVPPDESPAAEVNFDVLLQARQLIQVVEHDLGMPWFDDFRELMRLKHLREDHDSEDWNQINSLLDKAGKIRDPEFELSPQDPSDFEKNVRTALKKTPKQFERLFDGLPEVKTLEDAYTALVNRPLDSSTAGSEAGASPQAGPTTTVKEFIETALTPLSLVDFKAMMQIKLLMDYQWSQINQLLEQAGKHSRDNADYELPDKLLATRNFDEKLAAALPEFKFSGGLDAYFTAFLAVESYFYMPAENFEYIMSIATAEDEKSVGERDWEQVYEIVSVAHREMIYARRRAALMAVAQPDPKVAIDNNARALEDVLAVVLGDENSSGEALQTLDSYGVAKKNREYLAGILKGDTSPDWTRVIKLLETAQRNRENFQLPVAEKVEWRNLYPAADAKQLRAQSEAPDAETLPRWETFGRREPIPPVCFGWALASPLLALGEGKRTIEVTLGFSANAENFDAGKLRKLLAPSDSEAKVASFNPFQVQLSEAEGWLDPESVEISWAKAEMPYPKVKGVDSSQLRALVFRITISQDQAALVQPAREIHGIDTAAPVLRLMLKPEPDANKSTGSYQVLRRLLLQRVRLVVSVTGLSGLSISNDESVLDASKPFEPFGHQSATGSRFYLGHPEIVAKKLDSLRFNMTWMGAPPDFGQHYKNYPGSLANSSFEARVTLFDSGLPRDFSAPLPLFDATDATRPVSIELDPPAEQGDPERAAFASDQVTDWNRYLVWELTPTDFQHSSYATVALQKSLEMTQVVATKKFPTAEQGGLGIYKVPPPYTPKIKSLNLDYAASTELALDAGASDAAEMWSFHIQPFGYSELQPEGEQSGCPLLPSYDYEGELYIGLRNVSAPQNVSLLFQVAEGSANPNLTPEPVQWSRLSGNRWLPLDDGSLRSDATRGLINSGIVELSLQPVQPSTLLPADLYWIRAAIARSSNSVCDMIEIHPNAVRATFADNDNAPDHLSQPLPAESITAPVTPIPGISRLRQPYTSFGGKMAEQDEHYYVRVSERLRHKQRALTPWDYERLVLEKFPGLYKVKCLRSSPAAPQHDPGGIQLVVIPDIRNRLPFDPFEPKAPADMIRDIETFLEDKTPPFAQISVKNAHYVPVKVRCSVRFMPGLDEAFYRQRLNDELNRFLSPWAYAEGADLIIGGSVYANSIIDFIDRRDYVDYLVEFKLFTREEEGELFSPVAETDDGYRASTGRPDGILVAAREHVFDEISDADYRVEEFTGINYMKIELDFTVG